MTARRLTPDDITLAERLNMAEAESRNSYKSEVGPRSQLEMELSGKRIRADTSH